MYGKDGVRAQCMEILGVPKDSDENKIKFNKKKLLKFKPFNFDIKFLRILVFLHY